MNTNSITFKGKEYVSPAEFAKRLDTTPQTINKFIRDGRLFAEDVNKKGKRLLEWQTQSAAYAVVKATNRAKGGSGPKKNKDKLQKPQTATRTPIYVQQKEVKDLNISELNVGTIQDLDIQEIKPDETAIDVSKLDPYDNTDCWKLDGHGKPILDTNGNPIVDYDILKTKVMAQTYQVKLEREIGSLIPKEELISTVQGATTVLKSAVDNIAQKYIAPLIAMCENITRHEFTSEEQTKLANILRNVPKEIFPSVQAELEKLVENAETED